jgi:RNA polymerase sigma-70 factor (ECF subfamily)
LNHALDEAFAETTPLLIRDPARDLKFTEREALVRISIGNRCWSLRINTAHWSAGRRDACRRIVSGEGLVGEVLLYRENMDRGRLSKPLPNSQGLPGLLCRMNLWLRREHCEEVNDDCSVKEKTDIELMDINHVRTEICFNRVTFPAQIPTFPGSYRPDLQCRVAQLYFLMGWSFPKIAARYRLARSEARRILNEWKQRAARAGYLQHIPPPEIVSQKQTNGIFEDLRLISGLQAGEEDAYERVIDDFQSPVYNLAWRLAGDGIEAERITERAFRELFRNAGSQDGGAGLRTRLYRNVVDESCRSCDSRHRGHAERATMMPFERELQALHPLLRAVLVLKEVEGMTYEEVAEVLRISVSAVKLRAAKGREALVRGMVAPTESVIKDMPHSSIILAQSIESHAFASANVHSTVS